MPRSDHTICTSGRRPTSTAVSHGFVVTRYSSPPFGSHDPCTYSEPCPLGSGPAAPAGRPGDTPVALGERPQTTGVWRVGPRRTYGRLRQHLAGIGNRTPTPPAPRPLCTDSLAFTARASGSRRAASGRGSGGWPVARRCLGKARAPCRVQTPRGDRAGTPRGTRPWTAH